MKFRALLLSLVLLIQFPVFAAPKFRQAKERIPNRYLVVLTDDVTQEEVNPLARRLAHMHGGNVIATMQHAIKAFGFRGSEQAARALSNNPNVAFVEEDAVGYLASDAPLSAAPVSATNELVLTYSCNLTGPITNRYTLCTFPDIGMEYWNLDRTDQKYPITETGKSYGYKYKGSGIRAYVVDTGIRGTHSEFGGRVEAGANMTYDPDVADDPTYPNDQPGVLRDASPANNPCSGTITSTDYFSSHGTAVASALGGATAGAAKNVQLIPVKVGTCRGTISLLATARGLDWVLQDMQARPGFRGLVNMSLRFAGADQGYDCPSGPDANGNPAWTNCVSAIEYEINQLVAANIPVIVSAGNQRYDAINDSPSRLGYGSSFGTWQHTITVGGTMPLRYRDSNNIWRWGDYRWDCDVDQNGDGSNDCVVPSGWSLNRGSNHGPAVSIWAPAFDVRVAHAYDNASFRPDGAPSTGTSFASPLVAGIVARILDKNRTMSAVDVWNRLASLAENASGPNFDPNITNRRLLYLSVYE